MSLQFKPAKKENRQPRICIFGPSGTGKTYNALLIAQALNTPSGNTAVIDTEAGRSNLYEDAFGEWQYNVGDLTTENYTPKGYKESIMSAIEAGMITVIVDSVSHLWDSENGLKSIAESTAKPTDFGRTWSTAKRNASSVITDILTVPANVICTMRAAHIYDNVVDPATNKKTRVIIGEKPIFAKEFEFEFDVLLEVDGNHNVTVIKAPLMKEKLVLACPSVEDWRDFFAMLGTKAIQKPVLQQVEDLFASVNSKESLDKARNFANANAKFLPKGSSETVKKWVAEATSKVKLWL